MQNENKNIAINGKEQILEMIHYMTKEEQKKIIGLVARKNPTLAHELLKETIAFDMIFKLTNQELQILTDSIGPAIIGVALKAAALSEQKDILRMMRRDQAEVAYDYLNRPLKNGMTDVKRAQRKIAESLLHKSMMS
jgi:flagellar motor switch protein FliG